MVRKKINILGLFCLVIVLFTSCYYDVEEEIYTNPDCSTENMSYQVDILPIISSNCYECHSAANNFGNITLEGHNKLSGFAFSGQLVGVINHKSGYSPMPKNKSMLLECQIEKIESWVNDGALDN